MNAIQDLAPFQPQINGLLGFVLQWLRQHSGFRETYYHSIAVLLSIASYTLFHEIDFTNWRLGTIQALLGVSAAVLPIWGGTLAASNMAKAGVAFVPNTNSK